ncbi:MAG TPA: heavy metal translocating P-type ATPase [Tessaracoccus flavescens]|uniref:Heavy metal translocating P-type ATPase n=1 Tax=Tessaracoccus flavescens TaxID=399497 RepID=A0A921ENJ7_9ACTN|nr:heavy metal translocating P-type ATPase [Tessaracoccus flavescens]
MDGHKHHNEHDHSAAEHAMRNEHADHSEHPQHQEHGSHGPDQHSGHNANQQHADDGGHQNHDEHAGHSTAMFKNRFWLSLLLSIPVVVLSPMVADLLGYTLPTFPGSTCIPPVLGTIIFFYGGMPFLKGGIDELKRKQPGMMLLIAMAITVAFVASWVTTLGIGNLHLDFWWELALLVVVMLLGHWMEMRALSAASSALDALAEMLPDDAERVTDHGTETVSLSDLAVEDVVLVRSGARVPADGTIVSGSAHFDESMITGESQPVRRSEGERVVAGTVATNNTVRVQVEATGEDTAIAGIQRMVSDAQSSSSKAQALADRAAALLFWFALAAAVITAIVWLIVGSPSDAVVRTVTVLVIACPHALGLAIPLVIAISTELAAKHGILIKNRMALERMRTIDVVLFDKTGTLTEGAHRVTEVATADGVSRAELLALAAAAERDSEHPVARAIVAAAKEDSGASSMSLTSEDFQAAAGRGVRATVDGATIEVGGPTLLREADLKPPAELAHPTSAWSERGAGVLHVVRDGVVIGAVAVEDEVRADSLAAIKALQERGVKVALITGDAKQVADAVGRDLGIDEVFAEVLPEDKDQEVSRLQQRGLSVAMVGDGVNDAPALARADVGIAIGAGTDVAIESADLVLAGNDPRAVLSMIDLSRASYRRMLQNLVWAAGYNVVAVPLAAGVLAWAGIVLSPAVGAILMSLSTIIVALNAQVLRGVKMDPEVLAPAR